MHGTCDKCGSKENYNFVINNGLCDPCIEARLDELARALKELYAVVRGECPSLLNEDSGGNARLDMQIIKALTLPEKE